MKCKARGCGREVERVYESEGLCENHWAQAVHDALAVRQNRRSSHHPSNPRPERVSGSLKAKTGQAEQGSTIEC